MAESIISPGVLARENDISFIQPAPVEASAAIIGPTVKGPVERPTVVTSYGQYLNIFGSTFTSASVVHEYITSVAAKYTIVNGLDAYLTYHDYDYAAGTSGATADDGSATMFSLEANF